ncbi:hypothetical protein KPP03845_104067 [Streptomyces xanthophaeus]|nr:hypothetical protein KPP03845_104067 [Streptomyces xanthophaeus]
MFPPVIICLPPETLPAFVSRGATVMWALVLLLDELRT